ncbi:hypothetical protein [Veillonella parvula]|uniref:hypothetical protein n=1 Tax=Veillonella parvula TaxID=29466 RepID=UPI003AB6FF8D
MNDKEGCKWLLQKLYNKGVRYIVFDSVLGIYFGVDKPLIKYGDRYDYGGVNRYGVGLIADLLPDFNEPNYLDIGKYLGIVDWSKVAVDTPIKVRYNNGVVVNRHFSKFAYGEVYYFSDGRTSWSELGENRTVPKNVRLAGGDDEN